MSIVQHQLSKLAFFFQSIYSMNFSLRQVLNITSIRAASLNSNILFMCFSINHIDNKYGN